MACSPLWPKGGLPMSWARQAALTMLPASPMCVGPVEVGWWWREQAGHGRAPASVPTLATSSECVRRLCAR
jgi:hypothetical protein